MAVVTADEACEADELFWVNRGLDVLLPLAGALRDYNNIVVGYEIGSVSDNLEITIGLSTPQRQVLTNLLNKLYRFPIDVVGGLAGAEFCSVSYFQRSFASWHKDTVAGFRLDEAEREIASAVGLPCPKTITELVADDDNSIDFQFVDASAGCGIVLRILLKNTVRKEPLLIPLFRDVEGFRPISETPLLKAIHNLTDLVCGPEVDSEPSSPVDAGQESDTRPRTDERKSEVATTLNEPSLEKVEVVKAWDVATRQTIEVDVTGARVFMSKVVKTYGFVLPTGEPNHAPDRATTDEPIRRHETLYLLKTGLWLLVIFDDLTFTPPPWTPSRFPGESEYWRFSDLQQPTHNWELKYLNPEQAATWMTEVLRYSNEKLIVTFASLAEALPPIVATPDPPSPNRPQEQFGVQNDVTKFEQIPKGERRGAEKEKFLKILRLIRERGPVKIVVLVEITGLAEGSIQSNYIPILKKYFGIDRRKDGGGFFEPLRDVAQPSAS